MADADFGHRVPFMFLDDTRSKFLSQFGRTYQSAGEGSLNDTFSRTLSSQMVNMRPPSLLLLDHRFWL